MAIGRMVRAGSSSLLKPWVTRQFGMSSAAALECDYSDEDEYETRWSMQPRVESGESWGGGRGVQWVVMGDAGPGMRRHVFAEKLSKLLEVPLISMGSLLRQELNPRSPLFKQISNAVNEGKLVPEEVIFRLLSKKLGECYENGENGFILDGIPRTRIQAKILDKIVDIDLVVNFKRQKEHSVKRKCFLQDDRHMSVSGSSFWQRNLSMFREPRDNELEDYYRMQRKLVDFQVAGDAPGDNWQGLLAVLQLKHISAAKATQKISA